MRIGIVLYPTYGGSGVVATELGKALAKKGHEIHFITYSQPFKLGTLKKNIFYHEVRVMDYPLFEYQPYELVLSNKLVDVVKHEKLDLLHVHYAIPHATAAYMAKQILRSQGLDVPFITTLHGTDITLVGKDSSFEPAISFAINESDEVTAVSDSLREDTFEHFDVNRDIKVIPNFVCMNDYVVGDQLEIRSNYAVEDEKIITHISNFRKVKRISDLVRVFHKVRQNMKAKLLLVGDGPERHGLEELCRELQVCDDVLFVGKLKSVREVLSISDLFMLPSEFESFGLSALEAMASGVPVISTKAGGIPEVVSHGECGFLSDVGDVEDMTKNTLHLLSNEELLMTFKQNALAQAKKFDIKMVLPQYEELYKEVVS